MGRNTDADSTPLLKNAEQNIGNSETILPQVGPVTTIPITNPQRIIDLGGGSAAGQTTSVVVTVSRIVGEQNPNPGYPGPITGVIEFGNGARFTRAEFDVPVGPFLGSTQQAAVATEPQDGGIIITVPTGVMRVYTRYDNLLIAPLLNFPTTTVCLADVQGVPRQGPGGPVTLPTTPSTIIPPEPVLAKAMVSYFSRHFSRAYKTIYCYVGKVGGMGSIQVLVSSVSPSINPCSYTLPAFARSLKVQRLPLTSALTLQLSDGINIVNQYDIPAGSSAPEIQLTGRENIALLQSKTINDTVYLLALACEVGI